MGSAWLCTVIITPFGLPIFLIWLLEFESMVLNRCQQFFIKKDDQFNLKYLLISIIYWFSILVSNTRILVYFQLLIRVIQQLYCQTCEICRFNSSFKYQPLPETGIVGMTLINRPVLSLDYSIGYLLPYLTKNSYRKTHNVCDLINLLPSATSMLGWWNNCQLWVTKTLITITRTKTFDFL